MSSITLNASKLNALLPPVIGIDEYWDTESRGLCLRVFPSGHATWAFRYRPREGGGRRRIRIGEFPSIRLAEARRRADRLRGQVADGADPQADRQAKRAAKTLDEIVEDYLVEVSAKKKPRTTELYKWYLKNLVPLELRKKKAALVTAGDLEKLHRTLGAEMKVTANRVIICLSGVYRFGDRHRDVPSGFNPAKGIEKFTEKGRERFLARDELGRLGAILQTAETTGLTWPESENNRRSKHERKSENRKTILTAHVTGAIRLLLFTGCRLREILNLRWNEVDFERGLILLSDSKTGRRAVVLNAAAVQTLKAIPRLGDFVIAGDHRSKPRSDLKRPWELVRHHAKLSGVRLHDLRHTTASVGAGEGLSLPVIGKLLGHKHYETTEKYAHLADDPTRRASELIGAVLSNALNAA